MTVDSEKPAQLNSSLEDAINRALEKNSQKQGPDNLIDDASEPIRLVEDEDTGDRLLIYSTESGVQVEFHFLKDSLWMSQSQIAELFDRDVASISRHIRNILDENELEESTSLQKVQRSLGRPLTIYSLDMIISIGYRVSSKQATMFRKWATDKLVRFATKGFVVDTERLKDPDNFDHFLDLQEIIREIRASEKNLYKEVRRICSLCQDYGLLTEKEKSGFFATVQNKLHFAVTGMTGAEIRMHRAKASQPLMGLMSYSGDRPTQKDILTAKNFLGEAEVKDLNRFTGMLLDYFAQETDLRRLVAMRDASEKLDKFITNNERPLLRGKGSVSKLAADKNVKKQYALYKEKLRAVAQEKSMRDD